MPSLHDLQQAFASAVRFGDAAAVCRFVDANGIAPERRLRIYANNVREGFLGTLEATYPVLVRLAGHDWFRQTGTEYLRRHPSRRGNLHHAGERFPGFLQAHLADTPYAYFAEVARLEWAYQEVLVAAEGGALDLAELGTVPADQHPYLVFDLQPASRLVDSSYPVLAIWRANQPNSTDDASIDLSSGPSRVLVIRRPEYVELRELPAGDCALLSSLARQVTLAEAAAHALVADCGFDLSTALVRAARLGVFASFRVRNA